MTSIKSLSCNEMQTVEETRSLLEKASKDQLIHALCTLAYAFIDAAEPNLSDQDKWYKSVLMTRYGAENAMHADLPDLAIPYWYSESLEEN